MCLCACSLEELRLDRNSLRSLPASLTRLSRLRVLTVGYNLLETVPANLLAMRALTLLVSPALLASPPGEDPNPPLPPP